MQVVAVQSIEGFPEESWLYWLGDDIPDVAVWTLGYPASAFVWQGFTMELEEQAENITNLLLTYPGLDNNRPIIFVTHSMGGLLIKYILCRALSGHCTEPDAKSLVERTKGIVFLSTPHTGANLANFIEFVASLFTNPNQTLLLEFANRLVESGFLDAQFGTGRALLKGEFPSRLKLNQNVKINQRRSRN